MLSYGHDMVITFMKSQQWCLPTQGHASQNSSVDREEFPRSYPSQGTTGSWHRWEELFFFEDMVTDRLPCFLRPMSTKAALTGLGALFKKKKKIKKRGWRGGSVEQ